MKRISYVATLVLACALLLALLPTGALASTDADHWANPYVQTAVDNGWIEDGSVSPDKALTRAEFAVILWKAVGSPAAQGACPFEDVAGSKDATAVTALYEKGVVEGVSAKAFAPDNSLTRQEGITMLARAFGLTASNKNTAASFSDWADVASWAQDAISAAVEKGIVNGVGNNLLAPTQNVTLGELAKLTVVAKASATTTVVASESAIESVSVLGTVDWDCSKATTIVVKYNVDLTGADVSVDTYQVNDYGTTLVPVAESTGDAGQGGYASNGNGIQPGAPMKVYVNDKPEADANGGSGTGNYVIIEINTDFWTPFFPKDWRITMAADVKQVELIQTAETTILPGTQATTNYTAVTTEDKGVSTTTKYAVEGAYQIEGIDKYELHMLASDKAQYTSESYFYDNLADAFHATNCFDEADGQYWDLDLPYALYVPDDYDPSKEYALLLHFHDASTMGTNPLYTLTEARGPYNFVSDEFQQLYKDQGLGGCIVVCPAIAANYEAVNSATGEVDANHTMRVTTDNWTVTCVLPATWQLMDSLTEKYNICEDRIYGTGQSMGGMGVLMMAAQRDNYFAAIMAMSCKWGTNYDRDEVYGGKFGAAAHGYYDTPTQATDPYSQIPELDADGNASDYRNWYYRVSDDNIFFARTINEMKELHVLYEDLCGIDYPQVYYSVDYNSSHEESLADRLALADEVLAMENPTGLYEIVWTGDCSHNAAWMLGHDTWTIYEWCAQRTRTEENEREKLWNLTNDFELADEQKSDFDHSTEYLDGGIPTGKLGAGTGNYNSYIDTTHYAGWMRDEDGNVYQIGWTKDDAGNWYNTAGELIYNENDRK